MIQVLHRLAELGAREIARSPVACVAHLAEAGGAGLVTVLTVVFKILLAGPGIAIAWGALLKVLNLVLSFLLIQAAGFRLATKQSPLFGSALGIRWRSIRARSEFLYVLRSQALSAAGNLLLVGVGGILFHRIYALATGAPFLDELSAAAALRSLHPWRSATLGYAALTGFLLWFCGFSGGAIAQRVLPGSKAAFSAFFNILLGVALAAIPLIGHWTELPLDVRHFTLSGGTAAIAAASLGLGKALASGLLPALAGVAGIGVLNFGVSFGLSFVVGLALSRREGVT